MAATMNAATFMGKNFQDNQNSIKNSTDLTLKGQCVDSEQFLRVHLSYWMCTQCTHSITNSGLMAGGQHSSRERQTVFFTVVNPMNMDHKDPQEIDLTKTRVASYKQSGTGTKTRCIGSIFCLLNGKDLKLSNKM